MNRMAEIVRKTFLYNFLVSPGYRVWRHVTVLLCVFIISINQTYITYQHNIPALGNHIYWIFLYSVTILVFTGYFNMYVLVPQYLLRKRYTAYILLLITSVLLWGISGLIGEYVVYSLLELPHERVTYFNWISVLDILSNTALNALCIAGIAMTVLLRRWMTEGIRVSELEKVHIQTEVELLKEQANPQFLSNILTSAASLTGTDPGKASAMLYKLSQLLRYQLYDCSREKVLLTSEIAYLKNYLVLEQLYSGAFEFSVEVRGNINHIFVAPLIFIPFVREVIGEIYLQPCTNPCIHIYWEVQDETLKFTVQSECIRRNTDMGLSGILRRLDMLYPKAYRLQVASNSIVLEVAVLPVSEPQPLMQLQP